VNLEKLTFLEKSNKIFNDNIPKIKLKTIAIQDEDAITGFLIYK
jgi:hypothetical protein